MTTPINQTWQSNDVLYAQLAWLQFSAAWARQSETHRQLVIARSVNSKSHWALQQHHNRHHRELDALHLDFQKQREVLAANVKLHCELHAKTTLFRRGLGLPTGGRHERIIQR